MGATSADGRRADRAGEERGRHALPVGRVALALIALYVIWGSTFLAMRVALETIPPFMMSGPRFLLAGLATYLALRARGVPAPTRTEWWGGAKAGFLLLTVSNGALAVAGSAVSSGVAALVVATTPLWLAAFGLLGGRQTRPLEWAGLLLGLLGIALLSSGGALQFGGRGVLLLAAPAAWALGTMLSQRAPAAHGPMVAATQMVTAGATMLLLAALRGERAAGMPSLPSLLAAAYLVVFGSVVALSVYHWLLRNVRPALASSHSYVNPLVALALGRALGGEPITPSMLAAAAISLAGVALIAKR